MKSLRNAILWIMGLMFLGWPCYAGLQWLKDLPNKDFGLLDFFLTPFYIISALILFIPGSIYGIFPLPKEFSDLILFAVIGGSLYLLLMFVEKNNEAKEKEQELAEKERIAKKERIIREEEFRKEKEIERRKYIVVDIVNNLYKDTEKEVNKTLIPTLINELYDIYKGLHSENLNYLVREGSLTDFQNIINSIKSELDRLKKLAKDAQTRGFTDEEKEYAYSEEKNGKMTKEKAFEIFGINPSATKEEIKKAYRDMVKKYNTDQRTHYEEHVKQMLEDKMKDLNSAKDYLSTLGLI